MQKQDRNASLHLDKRTRLKAKPVVLVSVAGKIVESIQVDLQSDRSRTSAARKIADAHKLDPSNIDSELRRLSALHSKQRTEHLEQREKDIAAAPRLLDFIIKAILDLDPIRVDRRRRTVFLDTVSRSVSFADLFGHLTKSVEFVDAVKNTREGIETASEGASIGWDASLRLVRNSMSGAIEAVTAHLPDENNGVSEEEARRDELLTALANLLLEPRTFRLDCGTPQTSTFLGWSMGLPIADAWRQFNQVAFYARHDSRHADPKLAMSSDLLAERLRASSAKRITKELRDAELGNSDKIKVNGRTPRVFILSQIVIDHITARDASVPLENDNDNDD